MSGRPERYDVNEQLVQLLEKATSGILALLIECMPRNHICRYVHLGIFEEGAFSTT